MNSSPTESTSILFQSREELSRVLLAGLCFFLILSSYYLIRPIREQFASEMGGSKALPQLYAIVLATMLAATPIYGHLVAKYSRRIFVPVLYLAFVLVFFAIKSFIGFGFSKVVNGTVVFVYLSVFNLFVVSVFWSCMADCFSKTEAKRFFGYIAFAGSVGAYLAPRFLRFIIANFGADRAYDIAGLLMLAALGALLLMFQLSANRKGQSISATASNEAAIGGSWYAGAKACFESPFLRVMVLLFLCGDAIATILYANLSDYAKLNFPDPDQAKVFFSRVDEYTNLTVMILQFFVAATAIKLFGAGKTMAGLYAGVMFVLFAIAATGEFSLIVAAMIMQRGGAYGLVLPARESLFARVDRETRFKAKNFLDTAIWRFGDLTIVIFVSTLVSLGAGVGTFASICGVAAALGCYFALQSEKRLPEADPHLK
jgi:ATP:ADP antiporter, AAA family